MENEKDDLPNINERLGHLRPSRELLEYYRKKIADFDEEHEQMSAKLEHYKITYEDQHKLQWELRQREEEIVELQKALSDMQIYLFQEREHVLRLYSENDRLKIRELEDKKKIQQLLALSGTPGSEITYFMKEPPAKAVVEQRKPVKRGVPGSYNNNTTTAPRKFTQNSSGRTSRKAGSVTDRRRTPSPDTPERYHHDNEVLSLQVEALQSQLEEQTRLAKEQVEGLVEDRRVKEEEFETRRQRDEDKIKTLTEKLHKTQDLLYDSTKDFLDLRYEGRSNERQWMTEKDAFLQELDSCKEQMNKLNVTRDIVVNVAGGNSESSKLHAEEMQSLEYQMEQAQRLAEMYREQVVQLEDEVARNREEGDVTRELFKDRSDKMTKRLKLMNTRYQELEKRRNLEVEGFKTDIKNLRGRLKEVERQLYKVTLSFGEDIDEKRPDDIDMKILRTVRRTTGRSKMISGELKNLKAKVYSIENDLRHL